MKFLLVAGLPGSGKTHYAKRLDYDLLIDDPKDLHADVLDKISNHKKVIIVDPWFCLKDIRDKTESILKNHFFACEVLWIFFENDLKSCLKNIRRRKENGDTRVIEDQVKYFHQYYVIPQIAAMRPVYKHHNFAIGDVVHVVDNVVPGLIGVIEQLVESDNSRYTEHSMYLVKILNNSNYKHLLNVPEHLIKMSPNDILKTVL